MNICSCLLALVLGWNASAEIIHETVEVKTSVSLRCPHSVGTVTWSRESNGSKVDILTVGVDKDIKHIHDPQKRYSLLADKSLHIRSVTVSDSGRYFCNSEAAVELTVIPPGTTRLHATEGTRVTLTCPPDGGSDIKIWSSRNIEIKQQTGFYVSSVDQTLTITYVQLKHSGLYYCDGKPAAYLIVTEGQTTTSTPTTRPTATSVASPTPLTSTTKQKKKDGKDKNKGNKTTTTTTTTTRPTTTTKTVASTTPLTNEDTTSTTKRRKRKDRKDKNKGNKTTTSSTTTKGTTTTTLITGSNPTDPPPLGLVFGIVAFLLLVIIIVVVYFAWRRRIKRRGSAETCPVYEEIQDRVVFQPTNGGGSLAGTTASYCMTDVQDGSHHNDPMYCTIPELPPVEKKSETSLPNDSTYSLIGNPLIGGIDKGSSQLPENTYFLLEKPKKHGNNPENHL
ncbi:hypothetical protein VZT92_015777 [Zoarces viviparus]|uniref:Ig-like domain-containing protein n=1 Tax=Zoarces viviparus TaxID=48416 RepID=A0AAW1EXV1_ZOAVI